MSEKSSSTNTSRDFYGYFEKEIKEFLYNEFKKLERKYNDLKNVKYNDFYKIFKELFNLYKDNYLIYLLIFNNTNLRNITYEKINMQDYFDKLKIDFYDVGIKEKIENKNGLPTPEAFEISKNKNNIEKIIETMSFTFKLNTPYFSNDDVIFYPIDNPIRKDWVFKVPYIAPSQWKGMLRHVAVLELATKIKNKNKIDTDIISERIKIFLLFGNEKELPDFENNKKNDENFLDNLFSKDAITKYWSIVKELTQNGSLNGCLRFYPTFFDKIALDVINPHDRETGAGTNPIYFEVVPADTSFELTIVLNLKLLQYYLNKLKKKNHNELCLKPEKYEEYIIKIVEKLKEYGIGAKTTSGYGFYAGGVKYEY